MTQEEHALELSKDLWNTIRKHSPFVNSFGTLGAIAQVTAMFHMHVVDDHGPSAITLSNKTHKDVIKNIKAMSEGTESDK